MNFNAKQFFYLMIGVVIISLGAIAGAFYWGDGQLKNKTSVVSNLQTDRDIAQEKIIALQKARQSTKNSEEAERLLDILLPTTKSQETLIADILYTASQESNIPVENISTLTFSGSGEPTDLSGTEKFKEVSGVYSYPFSMTVQDIRYSTLLKLLKEIETNGRLVQIDDIQINPSQKDTGFISSVTLTMKAFLKP